MIIGAFLLVAYLLKLVNDLVLFGGTTVLRCLSDDDKDKEADEEIPLAVNFDKDGEKRILTINGLPSSWNKGAHAGHVISAVFVSGPTGLTVEIVSTSGNIGSGISVFVEEETTMATI